MPTFSFDPTLMPTTLDVLHLGLAALSAILTLVTLLSLTVAVMASRRRKERTGAVPAAQPVPAPVIEPVKPVATKPAVTLPSASAATVLKETGPEAALQLLSLLQSEARFLDFAEENLAQFSDADIGAAVRVVHEGCRKVLKQHFDLVPVRSESEGSRVTLPVGFDAASVRLVGNIVGQAPFNGTLIHRGWKVSKVNLPKLAHGHDARIVAPAEVEL